MRHLADLFRRKQKTGSFVFLDMVRRKLVRRAHKTIGFVRSLLGLSYKSRLDESDVFEMLRGKTVALVGNAASLSAATFGAAIDAHDVVIRFNAAHLPSVGSHGTRTTIIATSIVVEQDLVSARGAAHVFFMSPRPRYLPGWLWRRSDFFLYPVASHAALMAEIGARPSTGMMVIDLVRRSPCSRADFYGFDFFTSPSLSNARQPKSSPHDFVAERRLVAALLQRDHRFLLHGAQNPKS
jgi:hypothetical protein